MALGDMLRLVGGVILASRPSSRPLVSLCGSFDFPVSACGQDTCAVFVSSFSCVIRWRLVVSFSFSSRPSSRLPVSCGRLVSILCGSLAHPFYLIGSSASRFSSRSAVRLSHCLSCSSFLGVLSLRFISSASRCSVSLARLVKQSVFSLFAWRLVSTARRAGRVLSFRSFCSRLISLVAVSWP